MATRSALALVSIAATLPFGTIGPAQGGQPSLRGFTAKGSEAQRALEARFLDVPRASECRKFLNVITEDPHVAGSDEDRKLADYVRSRYLEYFGDQSSVEIVPYEVLLSLPKKVEITLLAPEEYKAKLEESGVPWDKDSFASNALPPFHGYSPSGDVTADLVYANYGFPDDYDRLAELNVDVRGKVVIARYGRGYRGVKVREAWERGAAAVLLYSDPADDGYARGDVMPRGPWRPETAVQRGSVGYMFVYPGDPLSRGFAAKKGQRREERETAESLPKIPSCPISYADATPLLRNLSGPNVPEGWQGHLPFAYHTGPGPARVRVKIENEFKDSLIWNVIAKWPGTERPDEWVIVGNHRDAWVHGAVDPGSGTASLLECARALGELRKQGFKPKRTIVFASWDAEEYGLVGSTEWAEERADELARNAVAYVNVDSAVSGRDFEASAAPSLSRFVREVSAAVEDPLERRSVLEVWRDRVRARLKPGAERPFSGNDGEDPPIGDLGSGSDYTAFQHHLGIPSIDVGFRGPYGVYHSVLDDFYWMERFGDPTFSIHRAMARWLGVATLRLAQADLLPIRPASLATAVSGHAADLAKKFPERPGIEDVKNAADRLRKSCDALDAESSRALESADERLLFSSNGRLMRFERELLAREGLKNRPFYRSLYSAPGMHAGYDAAALPGLREALEDKRRDDARVTTESKRLVERLGAAADALEGKTGTK